MTDSVVGTGDPANKPLPGERYGDFSRRRAKEILEEIRPPDCPGHIFAEMLVFAWHRAYDLEGAIRACREINDSGEEYTHPNADGAQALANLFSMVED